MTARAFPWPVTGLRAFLAEPGIVRIEFLRRVGAPATLDVTVDEARSLARDLRGAILDDKDPAR